MINLVIGANYGDEGKGKIVAILAHDYYNEGASVIGVRFSGGPQAAHNVRWAKADNIEDEWHHTFSTYSAVAVHEENPTLLTKSVLWHPVLQVAELLKLKEANANDENPPLLVHKDCEIITKYDIAYQRATYKETVSSCGLGIGTTHERIADGYSLRATYARHAFLFEAKYKAIANYYNNKALREGIYEQYNDHLGEQEGWEQEVEESFGHSIMSGLNMSFPFSGTKIIKSANAAIRNYDQIIGEGSQGLLLDEVHGVQPHTTWGRTSIQNFYTDLGLTIGDDSMIWLTTRAYLTRHGTGPIGGGYFRPEGDLEKYEANQTHIYQGEFHRTGLSGSQLMSSASLLIQDLVEHPRYGNKPTIHLVMNHCDHVSENYLKILFKQMSGYETYKSIGGVILDFTPYATETNLFNWIKPSDSYEEAIKQLLERKEEYENAEKESVVNNT